MKYVKTNTIMKKNFEKLLNENKRKIKILNGPACLSRSPKERPSNRGLDIITQAPSKQLVVNPDEVILELDEEENLEGE